MQRNATTCFLAVLVLLASCAPQTQPRATYRTVLAASPEHVYEIIEKLIVSAPKPKKSTKRWAMVSSDPVNLTLSAKALIRRAPTRANTGPGFERVDIRVAAYGEQEAELSVDYTRGAAYKLVQQVRVGVKKQLEREQAAARRTAALVQD